MEMEGTVAGDRDRDRDLDLEEAEVAMETDQQPRIQILPSTIRASPALQSTTAMQLDGNPPVKETELFTVRIVLQKKEARRETRLHTYNTLTCLSNP